MQHDTDLGPHEKPGDLLAWGSQAVLDVAAERRRQIEAEGWMPAHDDEHAAGEMAVAAACYALGAAVDGPERSVMDSFGTEGTPYRVWSVWPWDRAWHKPTSRRRDLVKAAALILAEIERLDRLTPNDQHNRPAPAGPG